MNILLSLGSLARDYANLKVYDEEKFFLFAAQMVFGIFSVGKRVPLPLLHYNMV
jgi:hypothetical protein